MSAGTPAEVLDEMLNLGRDSWEAAARETLELARRGCPQGADETMWYAHMSGRLQACVAGLLEVLGPTHLVVAGRHETRHG
jgi:hypothetical protein